MWVLSNFWKMPHNIYTKVDLVQYWAKSFPQSHRWVVYVISGLFTPGRSVECQCSPKPSSSAWLWGGVRDMRYLVTAQLHPSPRRRPRRSSKSSRHSSTSLTRSRGRSQMRWPPWKHTKQLHNSQIHQFYKFQFITTFFLLVMITLYSPKYNINTIVVTEVRHESD